MRHQEVAGAVFAALGDATRRRVIEELAARGAATATQLAADLPVTRQAVSKHLSALVAAGLVSATREGREVLYRLEPAPLQEAMAWVEAMGARWDRRMAALARHASAVERGRLPRS